MVTAFGHRWHLVAFATCVCILALDCEQDVLTLPLIYMSSSILCCSYKPPTAYKISHMVHLLESYSPSE